MKILTRGTLLLVASLLLIPLMAPAGIAAPMPAAPATRVRKNKVQKPPKRIRTRKPKGKSRKLQGKKV
jgi:hypothetical protein